MPVSTTDADGFTHLSRAPLTIEQQDEALWRHLYQDVLEDHEARRLHALQWSEAEDVCGYGSPSEADFQLALYLAFGTRDGEQVERLMRATPRARPKWDKHKSYLARTINNALDASFERYHRPRKGAAPEDTPEGLTLRGYTDAQMHTMPDPVWLIDGVIPASGLVEVVGRYGAGKTFLFIDWLMHVAGGMAWQGHKVQRGPCLYMYGEGHMKPRVVAWRAAHKVEDGDTVGVTYVPGSVNLLNDAAVDAFIEQVLAEAFGPKPVLIALDTLSRMAPGDENSPEHGAQVVSACERIQRATGAAVVLGHHTPWDLDRQRPKGSSKVPDCADAVFLLENTDGALKLTCQKMRDAETPGVLHLKLSTVPPALVVDAGEAPPTPLAGLTRLLQTEGPLTKAELQLRLGKSKRAVERLLQEAGTTVTTVSGTGVGTSPAKYAASPAAAPPIGGGASGAGTSLPRQTRQAGLGGAGVAAAEELPF